MKNIGIMVALLALSGACSNAVNADPYMGIGIGSASYDVDLTALGAGNFEENGTGTKLYGGYAFNKYYALEAAYYNFAEASGTVETSPSSGLFRSAAADMKGFGAYAVGMYPVSKEFSLIAKLGVLSWDADLSVTAIGIDTNGSNNGTDVAFSVAASYAFTKELLGVAEWESFDSDNPELTMLSIGFKFIFK